MKRKEIVSGHWSYAVYRSAKRPFSVRGTASFYAREISGARNEELLRTCSFRETGARFDEDLATEFQS